MVKNINPNYPIIFETLVNGGKLPMRQSSYDLISEKISIKRAYQLYKNRKILQQIHDLYSGDSSINSLLFFMNVFPVILAQLTICLLTIPVGVTASYFLIQYMTSSPPQEMFTLIPTQLVLMFFFYFVIFSTSFYMVTSIIFNWVFSTYRHINMGFDSNSTYTITENFFKFFPINAFVINYVHDKRVAGFIESCVQECQNAAETMDEYIKILLSYHKQGDVSGSIAININIYSFLKSLHYAMDIHNIKELRELKTQNDIINFANFMKLM